ncbi:MAG TPA: HAD family phosphatase [Actinomycetes bacterium]|nr:HAD family phosphatase [Actinomycetes bacterium]
MTTTPSSQADRALLHAVLFDMDGLLIDSEPQWFAAEQDTVRELGGVWGNEQSMDLFGSNLPFAADYMIRFTGTTRSRSDVMQLLSSHMSMQLRDSVTLRPGAIELLLELADVGLPLGLVTSSTREHAEVVLSHLPASVFAVTVTADDVSALKPHPMPYLTALDALMVKPERTIVLEDSPPGVAAARAAGCHVVAVPSQESIPADRGTTVVDSLLELNHERLVNLLA